MAFLGNVIPESRNQRCFSRKAQGRCCSHSPTSAPARALQSANYRQQFPGTTGFTIFDMFDARGRLQRDLAGCSVWPAVSWRRMPFVRRGPLFADDRPLTRSGAMVHSAHRIVETHQPFFTSAGERISQRGRDLSSQQLLPRRDRAAISDQAVRYPGL